MCTPTPRVAVGALLLATVFALGATEPISVLAPPDPDIDPRLVALGRALFHDPVLSRDGTISCASCHVLEAGGADGRVRSIGVGGAEGHINAPTVFNSDLSIAQFWDGRALDLAAQLDGPITSPLEMGTTWEEIAIKLYESADYADRFEAIWPDRMIGRGAIKEALVAFQRTLRTTGSRFDRYLSGDTDALSAREKLGYDRFKHYGCSSCHQGQAAGGNLFMVFGILNEYFTRRGNITRADLGRFNVTGKQSDRHKFKVPSLRLAAWTAPYLHDGSAATLRDAVDVMFEFQLGRAHEGTDEEREAIVAFIRTLAPESLDAFSRTPE